MARDLLAVGPFPSSALALSKYKYLLPPLPPCRQALFISHRVTTAETSNWVRCQSPRWVPPKPQRPLVLGAGLQTGVSLHNGVLHGSEKRTPVHTKHSQASQTPEHKVYVSTEVNN